MPTPAVALPLLALALGSGVEVPARLTFDDAVRIARERSPDLAIAEAGVASARAQVRAAGAVPNPSASFTAGWSSSCAGIVGCSSPVYAASLGDQGALALLVTGQRGLAVDAATQGLRGAEAGLLDARRTLEFDVKRQFVATSVAYRAVGYAHREEARAREAVELGRRRHAAGAIPAADLARLELLQLQVEQLVDRYEAAAGKARIQLARLLGMTDGAPTFTVVTGPTASAAPPARLASATLPDLITEARERRPDLAAARALADQARTTAALARRRIIPQFQLEAGYAQQGSSGAWFTPPTTSIGISLPLPVLYQQQGEIGVADAGVVAAEAGVARVEAQVAAEVASAFASFEATRRSALRAEQQLLQLSSEVRDSVGAAYAQGTTTLLDYLDTQRSRILSEVEYLAILEAFWAAVFEVERAVGTSFVP